jgi:prophage antirepressor-like protein
LFHIDHHGAVRSDRSWGKGIKEKFRRWGNNMVSQRLKKHGSDIVYLQKTKPCIRNNATLLQNWKKDQSEHIF